MPATPSAATAKCTESLLRSTTRTAPPTGTDARCVPLRCSSRSAPEPSPTASSVRLERRYEVSVSTGTGAPCSSISGGARIASVSVVGGGGGSGPPEADVGLERSRGSDRLYSATSPPTEPVATNGSSFVPKMIDEMVAAEVSPVAGTDAASSPARSYRCSAPDASATATSRGTPLWSTSAEEMASAVSGLPTDTLKTVVSSSCFFAAARRRSPARNAASSGSGSTSSGTHLSGALDCLPPLGLGGVAHTPVRSCASSDWMRALCAATVACSVLSAFSIALAGVAAVSAIATNAARPIAIAGRTYRSLSSSRCQDKSLNTLAIPPWSEHWEAHVPSHSYT